MRRAFLSAGALVATLLVATGFLHIRRGTLAAGRHAVGATRLLPLTGFVDPRIGTAGDGNLFPGATFPHGMLQWSPDTSAGGLTRPGGYNAADPIVRGFSLTHMSGAGCVAFGDIPLMPTIRPVTVAPQSNGSPYSTHRIVGTDVAQPGYYSVRLESGVHVQLTVTQRTGIGRFDFPPDAPRSMLIGTSGSAGARDNRASSLNASIRIDGPASVSGSTTAGHFCGLSNTYTLYFAIQFNRPFAAFGTWSGDRVVPRDRSVRGSQTGGFVRFRPELGVPLLMKVGVSYVSVSGARHNLQSEDPGWSLARVRRATSLAWNRELNRVQVGGDTGDLRTFYTALYHALIAPTTFSDADGLYRGFDGRVHVARGYTQYANFSGWDIYRSQFPLVAWLEPRDARDMVRSLLADAAQSGALPKWPVANANTGEMNGDPADAIIAEAYALGARGFDAHSALRFMIRGGTQPGKSADGYEERPGLAGYLQNGYVPPQAGGWGSAATTLEFGVDDFAIARLAEMIGRREVAKEFMRRSDAWRRLFNPGTGFIEPRSPHGRFPPDFDPHSTDGFVEGDAFQYTWMVPQNLRSLTAALGGAGHASWRLDTLFQQLNAGPTSSHYWGGNEPGLEIPWEYDTLGRPWKTQAVVRRIQRTLYAPTVAGLPGNDDLGTLSAWYVWSALGMYPEIPGVPGLALATPLFPRIRLSAASGVVTISAPGAGPGAPYIGAMWLDGRTYNRSWLPLPQRARPMQVALALAATPNHRWATRPADELPSFPP